MKLKRGINLGGYLSQCVHSQAHYEEFLCEEDIQKIAGWGFDHVRLPVDYEVFEDAEGNVREAGYGYVGCVQSWCQTYGLDMILDLHKAYGYDFNDAGDSEANTLFHSEALQQRFISLWKKIALRFGSCSNVAFELLNEVVENENAAAWNELIQRTVSAIRVITDTPIIYGGIQWNSASTLKLLEIPKHKNIIFTFHFYEPLLFTHQKAHWVKTIDPEKDIFYPETMSYYKLLSKPIGEQGEAVLRVKAETMGTEFVEEMICEAIDAAKAAGVELYCGEFGVIDQAPVRDTMNWFRDVHEVFEKHDIGCSIWTYKEMDFGLTGSHYDSIRDELICLWTK